MKLFQIIRQVARGPETSTLHRVPAGSSFRAPGSYDIHLTKDEVAEYKRAQKEWERERDETWLAYNG